ncbi:MAG TPA: radical SAM family heme chaperone HemW [Verrucomicrobiae bacterium]|nr:radical SAM family heme chaperone HemW [Verrucomicrobiae bacterium]
MIGTYLHVPFCTLRCSYCDFYLLPKTARGADPGGRAAFVDALVAEIESAAAEHGAAPGAEHGRLQADTAHFGGGTPSLLEPPQIATVLAALRRGFGLAAGSEIALEANPEDLTPRRCEELVAVGVTRLAVGVQSLDDALLARLRRPHDRRGAVAALAAARRAGIGSLAADLILGLPGQDPDEAIAGLRTVLEHGVDHVSLYLLEVHERTALGRAVALGRLVVPPADGTADLWERAVETLEARGFEPYEISNFARPGHRSRHNLKYWTDQPYLGFGPAAHSYLGGERWSNPPDLAGYIAAAGRPERRREPASPADRGREALYAGLRLAEGIDLATLRDRYGDGVLPAGDARLDELIGAGLLVRAGTRLALTRRGRLVSNEVLERLS